MEFSFSHLVRNCSDAIKFQEVFVQFCCRSPHGERGLKLNRVRVRYVDGQSLPTRGAWIESASAMVYTSNQPASLPTRGAWIEIIY